MEQENLVVLPKLIDRGHSIIYKNDRIEMEFLPKEKGGLSGQIWVRNCKTGRSWFDRFDLMLAARRKNFVKASISYIELSQSEIEAFLNAFVQELSKYQSDKKEKKAVIELSPKEREWGESFLNNKDMFRELLSDFASLGCVGEQISLLTSYLVASSRLLDGTLAGVITSQSGAGKSMVLNTVLKLIPDEKKKLISRSTPASFYYQEEGSLKHKAIFLAEEASAEKTDLAIRCLLSDGFINNVVTLRDPASGELIAKETKIEGPSSFLTTTTIDRFDDETLNRFLRLSIDENRLQTRKVMDRQINNRKLKGLDEKHYSSHIEEKHHAAQRLLKKIEVVHPYSDYMSFRDDLIRFRREHEKYLRLIDTIALLRQKQKEVKYFKSKQCDKSIPYIEASLDDIELANMIAEKVMTITLDELRPQARNLLVIIHENVCREIKAKGLQSQDYRFTRREIISWSGFPDTHIRRYLKELEDYEYIKAWSGSQGSKYEYELIFYDDPSKEAEFNLGLVDVNKLREQEQNGNGNRLKGQITKLMRKFNESPPLETGTSPQN